MMPDLTPYSAMLKNEKWMSKIDFIYQVKSRYDCSLEENRQFLKVLYALNFRQIMKDQNGQILVK
jgi:hypothetical protein